MTTETIPAPAPEVLHRKIKKTPRSQAARTVKLHAIFRNYYQTIIPKELIESGKVDGAGLLRTFRSLILPLSVPGFVVTMIWQFTSIWNDYLFAVFLSSKDNGPVILGLANLAGSQIVPYPKVFAGALIVTAPTLLVYILLGRWFVGGLMAGAVKS